MALTIRQRYARVRERLAKAKRDLWQIQRDCPHMDLVEEGFSNNYRMYHCPDCRRDWELYIL